LANGRVPTITSVVATFCHNIARDLPITVTDPNKRLELVYVDDVVAALLDEVDSKKAIPGFRFAEEIEGFAVTLAIWQRPYELQRESHDVHAS